MEAGQLKRASRQFDHRRCLLASEAALCKGPEVRRYLLKRLWRCRLRAAASTLASTRPHVASRPSVKGWNWAGGLGRRQRKLRWTNPCAGTSPRLLWWCSPPAKPEELDLRRGRSQREGQLSCHSIRYPTDRRSAYSPADVPRTHEGCWKSARRGLEARSRMHVLSSTFGASPGARRELVHD